MSNGRIFDVVVIGAGVEGSAAAYQLSKLATHKRIALVEQVGSDLLRMHMVRYCLHSLYIHTLVIIHTLYSAICKLFNVTV